VQQGQGHLIFAVLRKTDVPLRHLVRRLVLVLILEGAEADE
jgi:hypothetical protein